MKATKLFIPIFFVSALFIAGCSDSINSPQTPETFTYPDAIGSYWEYEREIFYTDIHPATITGYYQEYNYKSNGKIEILYDTVVRGETYRVFRDTYIAVGINGDTNIWDSRGFFKNTDRGFVCAGFKNIGGPVSFPFRVSGNSGSLGIKYSEAFNYFGSIISNNNLDGGHENIYDPPVVVQAYPVMLGKEWLFISLENFSDIYKKYVRYENVNGIKTVVTQRRWNTYPMSEMSLLDYISNEGQLKRDYKIKVDIVDEFENVIGSAVFNEIVKVTSYHIAE